MAQNGWAALGEVVAGGGNDGSEAYLDQYRKNSDAASAMWQARRRRAQAINQEGITPDAFIAAGVAPEQAGLAASVVGASSTPNVRNAGLSELADLELDRERAEAARAGDTDRLNRLTAVKADKLMERTRITQGQAFDPYAAPSQEVALTPLGEAEVAADLALADQRQSHASVYDAQAAQGGFRPSSPKAPKPAGETQAKVDWIIAQANKKLADGETPPFVDAWVKNEMVKAGVSLGPDFSNVQGSSSTVPLGESDGVLQQARAAIAAGADPAKVKQRLVEMGRGDLAGSL